MNDQFIAGIETKCHADIYPLISQAETLFVWADRFTNVIQRERQSAQTCFILYCRFYHEKIRLEWDVTEENGLSHYDVQRSSNKIDFIKLGTVNATNKRQYTFADKQPPAGAPYYRLKIVDDSSEYIYSPVIKLEGADPAKFKQCRDAGQFPLPGWQAV